MTETERPSAFFVADHPALDFLNTRCSPADVEFEWLSNGDDLLNWLHEAGLLSDEEAKHCAHTFSEKALASTAKKSRTLREWLREYITTYKDEGEHSEEAERQLQPLNAILSLPDKHQNTLQFVEPGENASSEKAQLGLVKKRIFEENDMLLMPIAEAIADLLTKAELSLIRNCEGPQCPLWFYDRTKNHQRRWCIMELCGNRAKAAAFRARKKAKAMK